jgi:antitoxin (DNA-binding transcriptional repressor) of toxin-antitoxin stability system
MSGEKGHQAGLIREALSEYGDVQRLSATAAARDFSELLSRVRYRGERFIIERGGVAIGELRPLAPVRFTGDDLLTVMRSLPPVDGDFLDTVEDATRRQPELPESAWER